MTNLRQPVRALMASAAILLLGMALTFSIFADTNSTAATQQQAATMPQHKVTTPGNATAAKPKAASDLSATSVLDADMLNSPVSYLREAFSAEEEENTTSPFRSGTVVMTLKALAASLLSTII